MKSTESERPSLPTESWAALLLLLAACAPSEASSREPEPAQPAADCPAPPPPGEADPSVPPRDNCLGCGRAFVPDQSKRFLDAYSKPG